MLNFQDFCLCIEMTKELTLIVAMQAMYGEDFIGTEEVLDVWYALLHDLDYHILSKAL